MRLAGIPIESTFSLFGSATTGRELFRSCGTAGLEQRRARACVPQHEGEDEDRYRSAELVFQSICRAKPLSGPPRGNDSIVAESRQLTRR